MRDSTAGIWTLCAFRCHVTLNALYATATCASSTEKKNCKQFAVGGERIVKALANIGCQTARTSLTVCTVPYSCYRVLSFSRRARMYSIAALTAPRRYIRR
jgi:hypothetical protein